MKRQVIHITNLCSAVQASGLSQVHIAEATGMSQSMISRYIKKGLTRQASWGNVEALARVLGVEAKTLVEKE